MSICYNCRPETSSEKCRLAYKVVCAVLAVFFLAATVLQANDKDRWLWIYCYGFTCLLTCSLVISIEVSYKIFWCIIVGLHWVVCFGLLIYVIVKRVNYSPEREIGGLVIILAWVAVCLSVSSSLCCCKRCMTASKEDHRYSGRWDARKTESVEIHQNPNFDEIVIDKTVSDKSNIVEQLQTRKGRLGFVGDFMKRETMNV